MMSLLRFAVVITGAGFLLLGAAASIGPGFPIAEPEPKPLLQIYAQALASLTYGGALVSAAFVSNPPDRMKSPVIWLLFVAPGALWALSSAPFSTSLAFLPFYVAVTSTGIAVLVRRRAA
jgi:hypothetical protein